MSNQLFGRYEIQEDFKGKWLYARRARTLTAAWQTGARLNASYERRMRLLDTTTEKVLAEWNPRGILVYGTAPKGKAAKLVRQQRPRVCTACGKWSARNDGLCTRCNRKRSAPVLVVRPQVKEPTPVLMAPTYRFQSRKIRLWEPGVGWKDHEVVWDGTGGEIA